MTSIEFLREKLHNDYGLAFSDSIIVQALEIHKAEILSAFTKGSNDGFYGLSDSNREQYYQETFGSKGSDDKEMERKLLKSGFVDIVPKLETKIIQLLNEDDDKLEIEIKKALLEMAKKCRNDRELLLNNYLENVSKNIDEIIQLLKQPKKD